MSSIKLKVKETLGYIKSNPLCDSRNLDRLLVKDLSEQGLVEGDMSREVTGAAPIFYHLRITLTGEEYLENLISPPKDSWRSSPIITGLISLVVAITAAGVIYYLGWK